MLFRYLRDNMVTCDSSRDAPLRASSVVPSVTPTRSSRSRTRIAVESKIQLHICTCPYLAISPVRSLEIVKGSVSRTNPPNLYKRKSLLMVMALVMTSVIRVFSEYTLTLPKVVGSFTTSQS